MRHLVTTVTTLEGFETWLRESLPTDAGAVLIQLFVGQQDRVWMEGLAAVATQIAPWAVVVGATSAGEIDRGLVRLKTTVVSALVFDSSHLKGVMIEGDRGLEVGRQIGAALVDIPELKGVLLLAPVTRIDAAQVALGLGEVLPDTPLFGGGAAGILGQDDDPGLLLGTRISNRGCVAVALSGADLHLETHLFMGWKSLGPVMQLTGVEGFDIRTIDDAPAIEAYRKYLGIDPSDEELFLFEFPLLIQRGEQAVARNPVSSSRGGAVRLVADVHQGEEARLGYLDVDAIAERVRAVLTVLSRFAPEAVLLYSCICRRFTLQNDVAFEILPFQALAATAGFFTYGEFALSGGAPQLLNSSQVVVALREGAAAGPVTLAEDAQTVDPISLRHARTTSRLFRFIGSLSEELELANARLRYQSEHDPLTGARNRRALDDDLEREMARAHRYGRPLALVMFDLDHFKRFNDDYGHAAGDLVLVRSVEAVHAAIRSSDTLVRFGGEEFLVLLPETDLEGAFELAEKLRHAIRGLVLNLGATPLPPVTASFGVALFPHHGHDGDTLLKAVDAATYRAKEGGRDRVVRAEAIP
ncbi:MAG: hypothetical protein COX57_01705 [Alphaproteobacteria bacterium CG_4_10_14_0_2_um_filter_63_37]|nr:MAG: hypothetical protein AUJ55_12170 [Proteobacteria bacterium CG1_02_64_396]PJA25724.1 MAG: hypothetical protein COX57_01705 [Alphaproteobacteria bacterium CG_4_10_14_0_2_um_filter_63_37]